ncbi:MULTISPECIES: M66 family metalloprotease [unclassified Lysobacter]|uniref:M66 family metalloprotease n=1 Tax=unclassified Lysobacter TaxID=2635362 RepID=UPI001BE66048|nr:MULTISPECIES: M66 family metalloprotease [unclassified Lysobacter]MBT2748080.1 hypothetical protein [Lysobacter sp. ISL-42]MBT2750385.1 hypothetical protein [Lysobacter sp. ISL-50]MBT2781099.1 hypothetical protein [Lysobacter sp. ISL-52]
MRTPGFAVAALWISVALALGACGGGKKRAAASSTPSPSPNTSPTTPPGSSPTTPPTTQPPQPPQPPANAPLLEIGELQLAQTHVLPEAGLSWSLPAATENLHAVGGRETLALLSLSALGPGNPQLEAWVNGVQLGTLALSSSIPATEAGGPAYATGRYSATLPAAWLVPGLQLRARADNHRAGGFRAPVIGADSPVLLRVLPLYLFGADENNSVPLATTAAPDAATVDEIFAKWPVASLVAQNHPAQKMVSPTLSIAPSGTKPAYLARNRNDEQAGFQILSAALDILGDLLSANGEAPGPVQYYSPVIAFNAAGKVVGVGGGWASVGGDTGTGDYAYKGIFIHEQGHAMGLPHHNDAYLAGKYPYVGGSLAGSAWGYDSTRKEFLAPFVPTTATRYNGCAGDTFDGSPRQLDAQGRCVKQDPMASGAGDQASGYRFATFADYSAAMMQRHLEGTTTIDSKGARVYSGGSIVADASFPGGYKRWDGIDRRWVNVTPTTLSKGLYSFDLSLPEQRDVAVQAIAIAYSHAGTAEVSQIYPPIAFRGNLRRYIDPTDAAQRASIVPGAGAYSSFCQNNGCDYTVRATYADGSVRHVLLQKGFRKWFGATAAVPAEASDPNNKASFRTWGINVPADKPLARIELLDTPKAWEGFPANPTVLLSREVATVSTLAAQAGANDAACVELATVAAPRSAAPEPRCASTPRPAALPAAPAAVPPAAVPAAPQRPRIGEVMRAWFDGMFKR